MKSGHLNHLSTRLPSGDDIYSHEGKPFFFFLGSLFSLQQWYISRRLRTVNPITSGLQTQLCCPGLHSTSLTPIPSAPPVFLLPIIRIRYADTDHQLQMTSTCVHLRDIVINRLESGGLIAVLDGADEETFYLQGHFIDSSHLISLKGD